MATIPTTATRKAAIARLVLFAFGLAFLGGGLSTGYLFALRDLRDWLAAREYVPAPAALVSVELKRHYGGKSTTYRVRATYRYRFRDQVFTGERVAISDGADNIGDYQRALYARLNAALQRGSEVTAWVNAADPRHALLDRDMRWGLFAFKSIFFVLFSLVGGGIAIYAWRAPVRAQGADALPIQPQPSGRIVSNTRSAMWFWWGFAVFWNLVSSPGLFFLPRELAKGNWPALLMLLFPAAGIWLLYRAVHTTLQWRRFGSLVLNLAPYPGTIGGTVAGTIELPERFRAAQQFRASLTCVRRRTTGSGRNRSTTDTALWQDETRAQADAAGRGTRLSVGFNVPAGLPSSGAPSRDYVFWTIDLEADLPGVDLAGRFEVPMIAAAPDASPAEGALLPAAAVAAPPDIPSHIVRIFHDGGATVFYYPLFRYPAMSVGLLVFSLIFAVPVVFLFKQLHGNAMDLVLWLMIAVFGFVGVLLFFGGLYALGNSLRVQISARGLTTVRRVYGFGFARHARLDEIRSIETKIGSQSNSAGGIRVRYRLLAHIDDGRKITVGTDIPGRALADYLAQRLRDACGLR